ncbi:hypothetical protein SARC_08808 [Sphaeroforma arctica JP610]|uniref:Protein yippee-like n=1 Tax=Sphaeroforma arctica JP610 TaxID=667725 RepID=A0A0L0FPN7_9EUKA|nr:hypothetical protein SARC_08808 [Sphaeroforma arctica JP610]KNC78767.1 hypothetical protein SARC_08808 [Sphaeroforma arctica JP610]|eukprot:XP_014152669.1 hypothetical protein SARC_08808 [Sphaeroforma arctica JP610]
MGMYDLRYLSNKQVYVCKNCQTHLSSPDDIISKSFQGAYGRAFLFNAVVNLCETGEPEDRNMTTGRHTVVDVMCKKCETVLGWKYKKAHEASQKYKEGKYILEQNLIQTEREALALPLSPSNSPPSERARRQIPTRRRPHDLLTTTI